MGRKIKDLSNQKFGKLTAIRRDTEAIGRTRWICECECGTVKSILRTHLTSNKSKSCGCAKNTNNNPNGHTDTTTQIETVCNIPWNSICPSTYSSYINMKSRCLCPSSSGYPWYGGKGIKVCQRWLDDYLNFVNDMGFKPVEGYCIDRIDPKGNYEKSNCQWLSKSDNAHKRHTDFINNWDYNF